MRNNEIGPKIRSLRTKKGFSQEALADRSGVSHRTVQRIENGESQPTGDTISRLAKTLEVAPDELMDWELAEDSRFLLALNFSTLTFIVFPILGILIPFILWMTRKDKVKDANELGMCIINFQINWIVLLLAFPAILFIGGSMELNVGPTFYLLIQWLIGMYLVNVAFILVNAARVDSRKSPFYPALIKLLK